MKAVFSVLILLVLFAGCTSGTSSSFTVTTKQDGKVTDVRETEVSSMTAISPESVHVSVDKGKLTWWVIVGNATDKRTFCTGQITAVTDPIGTLTINFSGTVEPNTPSIKLGRSDVDVNGMPLDYKIIKYNCLVIPGAGCETPTTRVRGNWPEVPLTVDYEANLSNFRTAMKEIPAPVLSASIDSIEIDRDGGKTFDWSVTATNTENRAINLRVKALFVPNTGERLEPRYIEFHLGPGEKRRVEGGTLRPKNTFKSVDGTVSVESRSYVK